MSNINPTISIITLNGNHITTLTNRYLNNSVNLTEI